MELLVLQKADQLLKALLIMGQLVDIRWLEESLEKMLQELVLQTVLTLEKLQLVRKELVELLEITLVQFHIVLTMEK